MAFLVIGLVILLLIVLALVLPVYVEMALTVHGRVDCRLRVFYFFRLLCWELVRKTANKQEHRAAVKEERSHITWSRIYRVIQVRGLWNSIWLLIKRLAHTIKIHRLESDLRISLGDDYYTGMCIGLLLPAVLLLNTQFSGELKMLPVFEEDLMLDGTLTGVVAVRPIRILAPMTAFIFSQPVWKAAWIMVRGK
ncbi:MAG: hypothetical protein NTZ34_13200 [Chloroflexi bacterium]|nr:hypothetical protein [Chloroflexota bacterium]